ncbi:NAD(P)+ transhydrogenase beta chain [Rhizobium sp. Root708]|uniref:NAD(P)+ transhydrogenase beta chain n=1 Tax=Rhizobium sp. Root708 TaxID=1736592 RepID=UPI000B275E43|nr:NAD(P)+ transhydrogenase beta chain [Rhizobium sp. Root708]
MSRQGPSYNTTKLHMAGSAVMAWLVIAALTAGAIAGSEQAVAFGMMAVPAMVALICGQLGLHRRYGSKDFAASKARGQRDGETPFPPSSSFNPRDDPSAGKGEAR